MHLHGRVQLGSRECRVAATRRGALNQVNLWVYDESGRR